MSDIPDEKWVELYTSAMLELKHALMAGRILEARTEIAARIEKLRGMPGLHELSPTLSTVSELLSGLNNRPTQNSTVK